ncbi:amidohydrolase family protein [Bordetella sp. H567]|uniref:amidohydrolase family protein n=1 Tax=Bordetella sp. H567 TaxID=1697043 RepID=UPI0009F52E42|nr:amidohydrolase family protein [Bordetella sp. H567]
MAERAASEDSEVESRQTPRRSHLPVRPQWLARRAEPVLEPGLPIIDPHHHLWDHPGNRYLLQDFLADAGSGHDIRATVFIECGSMYRPDGDPLLRPIGETEFANGAAAMAASGLYGRCRVAAGLVAYADLLAGDRAGAVLEAQIAAGNGRVRGIRNISAWHKDPAARGSLADPPPGMLLDASFQRGFSHLRRLGLAFDAWMYHTQLSELCVLAARFPDTTIVLNHVGGPIGIGPYANQRDQVFQAWRASIGALAAYPNVHLKVGGFGMRLFGFGFQDHELPPLSEALAPAWRPYVDTAVQAFGTDRCMFESNFPVDKAVCSYASVWNTFKRLTAGWSASERADVFSGTACRVYRLALD